MPNWKMLSVSVAAIVQAIALPAAGNAQGRVEIRTTSDGVPHIRANSFRNVGYGLGYSFAGDNLCLFAEKFVTIRGQRSEFFGETNGYHDRFAGFGGAEINNLASDFYHRFIFTQQQARFMRRGSSRDLDQLNIGFVDGYNRYLSDTPAERRPQTCRNAAWVKPITLDDLYLRQHQIALIATSNFVLPNMVAATPPNVQASLAATRSLAVASDPSRLSDARGQGSNALALGREATADGRGLLLGNPHFPWTGTERLYQMHLTVPGKLDIYGAGAYGQTLPFIGFNRDVAWSTTWSTDQRGVFYRLTLDPADPTRYRLGNRSLAMKRVPVKVSWRGADGNMIERSHSFYNTELGPVVGGGPYFPWTRSNAITLLDANRGNNRWLQQFLSMAQSGSVDQLLATLRREQGNPINNTIAADRQGRTLYADMGIAVDVRNDVITTCVNTPEARAILDTYYLMMLDGSNPACAPRRDRRAPQAGIVPASARPSLIRDDYIVHSNDSHWIVNADPATHLSGFDRVIGDETLPRNERTRAGMAIVRDRLAGSDGLPGNRFDRSNLERIFFAGRYLHAEQNVDDVLASCRTDPRATATDGAMIDLSAACAVLARWNRHVDAGSVGSHIFREFIARLPSLHVVGLALRADQYNVPFSAQDAINTPRGLKMDAGQRRALADAVQFLTRNGIALDARLGDIQFIERDGVRLPLGGDPSTFHNLRPRFVAGSGYSNIIYGDSYIQIVGFGADGPEARAITSYSQSTGPDSPHFADMTRVYSSGTLRDVPFTDAQITADPAMRNKVLER
jgi:acyl-homoserine-lactone acylase